MKEKVEKQIETFVYAGLSFVFAAAFFFGVLYPSQGISSQAYRVVEEPKHQMMMKTDGQIDMEDILNSRYDRGLTHQMKYYGKEQIYYKSYFYECLKSS